LESQRIGVPSGRCQLQLALPVREGLARWTLPRVHRRTSPHRSNRSAPAIHDGQRCAPRATHGRPRRALRRARSDALSLALMQQSLVFLSATVALASAASAQDRLFVLDSTPQSVAELIEFDPAAATPISLSSIAICSPTVVSVVRIGRRASRSSSGIWSSTHP